VQEKKTTTDKVFLIIKLFETGRPVTIRNVMDALGVSKTNARRWIDRISPHLLIYEYKTPFVPVSKMNPMRYILRRD
jgi:response regulator of citrate/malate metabolism